MAVVTFVSHDGEKHEAPLEEGSSLMQVATNNAIPGIDGDCGGEAACGTCHVVVDPAMGRPGRPVRPRGGGDALDEPRASADLSAVVPDAVSEAWDGLIVQLPEFQM